MWLLGWSPAAARAAAGLLHRVAYAGEPVPPAGPALLVANHPSALVDPVLVLAAARRPVRFLAKAPLFRHPAVGWLVRGAGAIPVFRRADDPSLMVRNTEAFRQVQDALAAGAAVGIFPEGISHNEPSLAPLRTGAARIALGARPRVGAAFPIVPLGLVHREKEAFRSQVLVAVGAAVPWDDLATRHPEDPEAVHALTERIGSALAGVTLNLRSWQDRPLVECAVRIWEAERRSPWDPAARVERLALAGRLLAAVRARGTASDLDLLRELGAHAARLERLGLRPSDLAADVGIRRGLRWSARRVILATPPVAALAGLAYLAFLPARWITMRVTAALRPEPDVRSTVRGLAGTVVYGAWVALLVLGAGMAWGIRTAAAALAVLPAVGFVGMRVRERWRGAWRDARRFVLLRSRRELAERLASRQQDLGRRLHLLVQQFPEVTGAAGVAGKETL